MKSGSFKNILSIVIVLILLVICVELFNIY